MKKIVNYRPIFFVAMSLIIGGYSFVCTFKYDWCVFLLLGLEVLFCGYFVWRAIKRKETQNLIRAIGLVLIPFILGGIVVVECVSQKQNNFAPSGVDYLAEGVVCQGGSYENGDVVLVLEDVKLTSTKTDDAEFYDIAGDVYVYGEVVDVVNFSAGDRVVVEGRYNYTYNEISASPIETASGSVGVINATDITIKESGSGIKYNILKWSKRTLNKYMDKENAEIVYGMLFGEKTTMTRDTKSNFQLTGLSHLLAVSGLHVGFVITFIGFILKKFIKKEWLYSIILIGILIFYTYLCNWSPSIVRAVSMCAFSFATLGLSGQYDGLNSLSFAGIINFAVDPLNIFNVGFLLSFSVVFALFAIAPQITRSLETKMPAKLASSIGPTVASWLASTPITIYYFNSLTPYAIITNFLVLPFAGFIFIISIVSLMLTIIPFVGDFFLSIANWVISGLRFVLDGFAGLSGASIEISCSYPILILGIVAIFLLSEYVFVKRRGVLAGLFGFGFICCSLVYSC